MEPLIATGLSSRQLSALHARGALIKVQRGLYLTRQPTGEELAAIMSEHKPKSVFTGQTAAQLLSGQPVTLPLALADVNDSEVQGLYSVFRSKQRRYYTVNGLRAHVPILAVSNLTDEDAIEFLEHFYAGRKGRERLERERAVIKRVPARNRELLARAAIGSDSVPERILVKALRAAGLTVETNVQLGNYVWDIVDHKRRIAIEIDGYAYHRKLDDLIRDSWKGNESTLDGWRVLRYTANCVMHHLDEVVDQVVNGTCPAGVWKWHSKFSVHDPMGLFGDVDY